MSVWAPICDTSNYHLIIQRVCCLKSVAWFRQEFGSIRSLLFVASNWWMGKPSESKACMEKQQHRFYWSCSSVEMKDATPLTPKRMIGTLFANVNNVQSMIPEDQKNETTQWWRTGRHFYSRHSGMSKNDVYRIEYVSLKWNKRRSQENAKYFYID